ncbi:MAG: hypothetical protein HGA59_09780 [Chlorobiaceae bacterium]|nr:hypothetical protein [Chlorobiaceae bacterium]NTV16493.1 hypothetical protein [Chlorobiaceae bacterium]
MPNDKTGSYDLFNLFYKCVLNGLLRYGREGFLERIKKREIDVERYKCIEYLNSCVRGDQDNGEL